MQDELEVRLITIIESFTDDVPLMYCYAYLPEYSEDEIDKAISNLVNQQTILCSENGLSLNKNFVIGSASSETGSDNKISGNFKDEHPDTCFVLDVDDDVIDASLKAFRRQGNAKVKNNYKTPVAKNKTLTEDSLQQLYDLTTNELNKRPFLSTSSSAGVSKSTRINNYLERNSFNTMEDMLFHLGDMSLTKGISDTSVMEMIHTLKQQISVLGTDLSRQQLDILSSISHSNVFIYDMYGCLVAVDDTLQCDNPLMLNPLDLVCTKEFSDEGLTDFCSQFTYAINVLVENVYNELSDEGYPINKASFYVMMLPYAELLCAQDCSNDSIRRAVMRRYIKGSNLVLACLERLKNEVREVLTTDDISCKFKRLQVPQLPCYMQAAKAFSKLDFIDFVQGKYLILKPKKLSEWISELNDRNRQVVELRLSGHSLQEAADKLNITRERVRQIFVSLVKKKPILEEDQYSLLFPKYDLSCEEFIEFTNTNELVFNYLKLVSSTKNSGTSKEEILFDPLISDEVKARVRQYLDRDFVYVEGRRLRKDKREIVEALAEVYAQDAPISINEFSLIYDKFIFDNKLDEKKFNGGRPHAFETYLNRSDCIRIIPSQSSNSHATVHFHEYSPTELRTLISALDSWLERNIECSTKLLFQDSEISEICELLDIRDYYELHVVIKSYIESYGLEGVKLGRIPIVVFGDADRKSQVFSLIQEMSPVTKDALADAYCRRYGVSKASFVANYLNDFVSYKVGNVYECRTDEINEEQKSFIKSQISKGYAPLAFVRASFHAQYPNTSETCISYSNLQPLGLHTEGRLIVEDGLDLRKVFATLLDQHLDGFSDTDDGFGVDVCGNDDFKLELETRLRALDFIEYKKGYYVSPCELTGLSIDEAKALINDFIDKALEYAGSDNPFNTTFLRANNFSHELMGLIYSRGYDDYALDSAISIRYVGGVIRRMSLCMTRIFCVSRYEFTAPQLVEDIVSAAETDGVTGSADIDEIQSILENAYGVWNLTEVKLREIIRRSDLIIDDHLEMAFASQESYESYKEEVKSWQL